MRRIAALAFALIGATVLFAVSAVGASATEGTHEPAFYECKKIEKNAEGKYTGEFTNKACSETSVAKEGKYELKEGIGAKPGIKGKSGHAELESSVGKVECTSSKSTGELTSPTHIGHIHVTYKGCTSGGFKCTNIAKPGTLETKELQGDVGYLNKTNHEVGVLITPVVAGGNLAEFTCGEALEVETKGGVIGQAGPVNEFTKLGSLTFKKSAPTTQQWKKFEGETAEHELETQFSAVPGFRPSSQEQTNVQKGGFLELKG
jgi:hypothetical protein